MKTDKFAIGIILILSILLTWSFLREPEQQTATIEYDTLFLPTDTVYKEQKFQSSGKSAKIDSISVYEAYKKKYITEIEVDSNSQLKYAYLPPTSIVNGRGDTVNLSLKYYFPPVNSFEEIEISYREKIIEKTKEIMKVVTKYEKMPFYKNQFFWIAIGEFILLVLTLI